MTLPLPGTDHMVQVQPVSRDEWYALASQFLDLGYRHAWDFNLHAARRQGSQLEHVRICDGDGLAGLASVRVKRVPLVGSGVAYVGGGPLTRRGAPDDLDRLSVCLAALRDEYVVSRNLVLRISPPVTAAELIGPTSQAYASAGFEKTQSVPGYRTVVLDLSPSLEDLRSGLTRRWRRDLTKSEKTDWDVVIGSELELFDQFQVLFESFVDWKAFEVEHDARFHGAVHADLPDSARYLVVLLRFEGAVGGGIIIARTGDTAVYLLGATNPELRSRYPGYVLQWQAIEHLKELGIHWYDLGGVDPDGNPGVHRFKLGISKVEVEAPGPFECGPGGYRQTLVALAEKAYGRLRQLRRR